MNKRRSVAEATRSIRFSDPEEAMANSPMRLYHEQLAITSKQASLWPGGADADGPEAVAVLGHSITLVAGDEKATAFRLGKVSILLSDSEVRLVAEVASNGGVIYGSLGTSNFQRDLGPELAAQIYRQYAGFYEGRNITVIPGGPGEKGLSQKE